MSNVATMMLYLQLLPEGYMSVIREVLRTFKQVHLDEATDAVNERLIKDVRKFPLFVIKYFIWVAVNEDPEKRLEIHQTLSGPNISFHQYKQHVTEQKRWNVVPDEIKTAVPASIKPKPKSKPAPKVHHKLPPLTNAYGWPTRLLTGGIGRHGANNNSHKEYTGANYYSLGPFDSPRILSPGCFNSFRSDRSNNSNATNTLMQISGVFRSSVFK